MTLWLECPPPPPPLGMALPSGSQLLHCSREGPSPHSDPIRWGLELSAASSYVPPNTFRSQPTVGGGRRGLSKDWVWIGSVWTHHGRSSCVSVHLCYPPEGQKQRVDRIIEQRNKRSLLLFAETCREMAIIYLQKTEGFRRQISVVKTLFLTRVKRVNCPQAAAAAFPPDINMPLWLYSFISRMHIKIQFLSPSPNICHAQHLFLRYPLPFRQNRSRHVQTRTTCI